MSTNTVPRWRLSMLGVVTVALFVAMFARLYGLQIVDASEFQVQAEANRVRLVHVPAPRGRILDRNGKVLVDNRISVVVAVERNSFDNLPAEQADEVLVRLVGELNRVGKPVTVDGLRQSIHDERFSRYAPVPVAQDVPEQLKIYLEEHTDEFPSVSVERMAVRSYPYGQLAANVLGYVGKISDGELSQVADNTEKPYTLNDDIGKSGVEKGYEAQLRGTPGLRRIEVDAEGDPVRVISETLPVAGSDVVLSIDIDVQALAQQRLEQGLAVARERPPRSGNEPNSATTGAVVVEDPTNGQVLAMASYPTYDPNTFVDGIDASEWAYLTDPANHYPLNNWAIQGQWASGSTFKLFTGYAALQSGLLSADTVFYDSGGYQIPGCRGDPHCFRSNAGGAAYGRLTIPRALTISSDAFFYNVGAQFWLQRDRLGGDDGIQQYIRGWGIGSPTGIPLADELSGRLPTPQWKHDYCASLDDATCDDVWRTGDNVNLAVGQGDVLVTPLQLANGYATFANGGTRFQPQIAIRIEPPGEADPVAVDPVVAGQVDLPPEVREPILEGLIGVTQSGTAARAFSGFDHQNWTVAGKTGTAQVDNKADTAVFASFGPVQDPRYAISVFMGESGFGGTNAAPVARALFDALSGAAPLAPAPLGGQPAADIGGLVSGGSTYD
jgi:penicillin-binding protein 2